MIKNRVCGVYKIENTITGDFYIGSSRDVKLRWSHHKYPSTWKNYPNSPMYNDMQKYGVENFEFTILCEVESEQLKETEQEFIETLSPTYNQMNANGLDIERYKKYQKDYNQSEKCKDNKRKSQGAFNNQLCFYKSETVRIGVLVMRFCRAGIEHPTVEAKKYLIKTN